MKKPEELYDLLFDYANLHTEVEQVLVGLDWTLCRAGALGLARTNGQGEGRIQGRGSPLQGRTVAELSLWLRKWDPRQAAIGMAAVNAAINREADMVYMEGAMFKGRQAVQGSLEWFLPLLANQRVVAAGEAADFLCRAGVSDIQPIRLPAAIPPDAEALLPAADWVFLPARTITDKTLPRLLELSSHAKCVLYGTEVPWLEEWGEFGIDYLVGSQIDDAGSLYTLIGEGASQSDLAQALSYRIIAFQGTSRQQPRTTALYRSAELHLV